MDKIRVAILGATGAVGQKFVQLLTGTGPLRYSTPGGQHPWFEITALAASEQSAGKRYGDIYRLAPASTLPEAIREMRVVKAEPGLPCDFVFSGLDSNVAGDIETAFAQAGCPVISNSKNHRWDPDVPLLIPEVNADHVSAVMGLPSVAPPAGGAEEGHAFIATNPNCATVGLAMALKPLHDAFGISQVAVVTMQAVSGAGYPGVPSLDIIDNVVPFISDEEEKVETELLKILGSYQDGELKRADITISASCNRVPVLDGHLECAFVKLRQPAEPEAIIQAWQQWRGAEAVRGLPSAPEFPVQYFSEERFPQPRLHRDLGGGMVCSIGRLRKCSLLDYKFVLLSHNTVRGAAGGAILNAELLNKLGYLQKWAR